MDGGRGLEEEVTGLYRALQAEVTCTLKGKSLALLDKWEAWGSLHCLLQYGTLRGRNQVLGSFIPCHFSGCTRPGTHWEAFINPN